MFTFNKQWICTFTCTKCTMFLNAAFLSSPLNTLVCSDRLTEYDLVFVFAPKAIPMLNCSVLSSLLGPPYIHPLTPHSLPQRSTEGDSQLTLLSWNSQVYVPKILEIIRRKPPLFQIVFGLVFKWLLLSWFGICNASRFWGPFLHLYCLPFLLQMSQNTFQLKLTGNTQSDGPLFTCHAPL